MSIKKLSRTERKSRLLDLPQQAQLLDRLLDACAGNEQLRADIATLTQHASEALLRCGELATELQDIVDDVLNGVELRSVKAHVANAAFDSAQRRRQLGEMQAADDLQSSYDAYTSMRDTQWP